MRDNNPSSTVGTLSAAWLRLAWVFFFACAMGLLEAIDHAVLILFILCIVRKDLPEAICRSCAQNVIIPECKGLQMQHPDIFYSVGNML